MNDVISVNMCQDRARDGGQRATGGCVASCTNGTTCNPRTGFCEALPCRGLCGSEEHCENSFAESKCVPGVAAGVATKYLPGAGLIHGYFGLGDASETARREAQRARADFKALLGRGT